MPKKLLFYVVCPTCEIKIGVHDPKRIGDLIQCPKCSSFVQLDPPEGFVLAQGDSGILKRTEDRTVSDNSPVNPPIEASSVPNAKQTGNLADNSSSVIIPPPPPVPGVRKPAKTSAESGSLPLTSRLSQGAAAPVLSIFDSDDSDSPGISGNFSSAIPEPMIPEPMLPEPMALDVPKRSLFAPVLSVLAKSAESVWNFLCFRWPILIIGLASILLAVIGVCLVFSDGDSPTPVAATGAAALPDPDKTAGNSSLPEKQKPSVNTPETDKPDDLPAEVQSGSLPEKTSSPGLIDGEEESGESETADVAGVPVEPDASGELGITDPSAELESLLNEAEESSDSEIPSQPSQELEVKTDNAEDNAEDNATENAADVPLSAQANVSPVAPADTTSTVAPSGQNSNVSESAEEDEMVSDLFKLPGPDPFAPADPSETALIEPSEAADSLTDPVSAEEAADDLLDSTSESNTPVLPFAVQKALDVSFARIEIKERSFLQTLQFLGSLGIPIELNWQSLKRMNVQPDDPISYVGESDTAESVFREALAQRRLAFQWNDKLGKFQLLPIGMALTQSETGATAAQGQQDGSENGSSYGSKTANDPSSASAPLPGEVKRSEKTERYQIGDLTDGSVDAMDALTTVVKKYISPESWTDAGGLGRINSQPNAMNVTQTARVHWELSDFLDRLRIARRLPPLIDPKATRENLAPLNQRASGILSRYVNVKTEPSMGLKELLATVSRRTDVPIVLDELSLKRAGVSSSFPMTVAFENEALGKALSQMLTEPGLTFFADTPKSLIVTTEEGVRMFFCVEFYSIGDLIQRGVKPTSLIDVVQKINPDTWQDSPGRGCIDFDPKSDCLVVRQSPDVHLNISVLFERLRTQWKKNSPKPQ